MCFLIKTESKAPAGTEAEATRLSRGTPVQGVSLSAAFDVASRVREKCVRLRMYVHGLTPLT